MAYRPIYLFNDNNVPDDDELEYCNHLILSRHFLTPVELINKARYVGVLKPLLEHKDTAYLVPYYNLMKEAENLIRIHYKDKFKSFLSDKQDKIQEILPVLFHDICRYCAVDCATAFFESDLHGRVNLHDQFVTNLAPLEYAALHLSYDMTQILLHHGADPSRNDCYFHGYPLHTALTQLCSYNSYVKQWTKTKEKSIFKLFYILCLPELKEPLDTIGLLASHTKQVEEIFDDYIVAGRIPKLIVLLMAARDDLLVPSTDGGSVETTRIGQYITRELTSNRLEEWLSRRALKENLMDAKVKVETLWRAIDVLERYRNSPRLKSVPKNEVPFHIAVDLMDDAGFELKLEDVLCDDMECMWPNLSSSNAIDFAKRIGLDKHNVFGSGLCTLVGVKKPATGCSLFSSLSKSNFLHHEYHTFPAVNSYMLKPMETQLSKALSMKPALHTVLASARVCAPLLWIAKRSIK